jgi:hypothetical protein
MGQCSVQIPGYYWMQFNSLILFSFSSLSVLYGLSVNRHFVIHGKFGFQVKDSSMGVRPGYSILSIILLAHSHVG